MKMLYVIGEPGAGKSTIVRHLTRRVRYRDEQEPWVYYMKYDRQTIQLGKERENFGGTDALGMASQKHVIRWLLNECTAKFVLAEGDRLANEKFFRAMTGAGVELTVVTLLVQPEELARRREARNRKIGKKQNEQWLKTRATKVVHLWTDWGVPEWTFDTTETPAAEVSRALSRHPVGQRFVRHRRRSR